MIPPPYTRVEQDAVACDSNAHDVERGGRDDTRHGNERER